MNESIINSPEPLLFDRNQLWHPYTSLPNPIPALEVIHAQGVYLTLSNQVKLVDAMASWWSVIHGYNHAELNKAAKTQLDSFSHVMFGGLTHRPAIDLAQRLVKITPEGLDTVFFSDSGSVAVEVAMKMAIQYWQAKNKQEIGKENLANKNKFVALKGGYHGDTIGAMSVCDPITGMHHLFNDSLQKQYFVDRPSVDYNPEEINALEQLFKTHHEQIAAFILEPLVQGAGGMYFYSKEYLYQANVLCKKYNILLIADEIATGFGRTGHLFACEEASITPDILCLGKALTGGYLSLAATLTTKTISNVISQSEAGAFMHGPTFMANALACSIANKNIELLLSSEWQKNILRIENALQDNLLNRDISTPLQNKIYDIRVKGAIGVIETHEPVDMQKVQALLPELGVWLRPFGKLVYTMPPYIISNDEIKKIADAMFNIIENC